MPSITKRKSNHSRRVKTHDVKSPSGKTPVTSKSVKSAKKKTGAFKPAVSYKGKTIRDKNGKMAGYKTHSGEYTRTSTPTERMKGRLAMSRDRKLQAKSAKTRNDRNKRFASASKRKRS